MSGGSVPSVPHEVLVQLAGLQGQPVRLTFLDTVTRERVARVPGVLDRVGPSGLVIDTHQTFPALPQQVAGTIEVLAGGDLFCGETAVLTVVDPRRVRVQVPNEIQTIQRRRHVRVDIDMPVTLFSSASQDSYQAHLRDLSAGGASLTTDVPFDVGEALLVGFHIGSGLFLRPAETMVLRCSPGQDETYILALQFRCDAAQEGAIAAWVHQQLSEGRPSL